MQATTQSPPELAPTAPPPPAKPVTITVVGADGKAQTIVVPRTQGEVQDLLQRREELSSQLNSVTSRRSELVQEVRTAPDGAARTGLEDRIRLLDQRILSIEGDLASIGQQLSAAPAAIAIDEEPGSVSNSGGGDWEEGMAVGALFSLGAVALVYAFRRWRRRRNPNQKPSRLPDESAQRLERLEQGMEAIAIEIERVSEGQRFVTRLLSEQRPAVAAQRIPESSAVTE